MKGCLSERVSKTTRVRAVLLAAVGVLLSAPAALGQISFEAEPINYHAAVANDPVAKLQRRMDSGEVTLRFTPEHGYLESVLGQLRVPLSSQVLVFSKTSFQLQRIYPKRPRALYFNDEVYIGYCQEGDVVEVASVDPSLGTIFYTLEQQPDAAPQFVRDKGQCLICHASARTQDVPGTLVRSVFADNSGQPVLGSGTYTTDHTSPLRERWGGWYVTGTHGRQRHMGNVIVTNRRAPEQLNRDDGANVTTLAGLIDTQPYLTPHSDIVALMVLEHQTQMHNVLTRANFECRSALNYDQVMNQALNRPADQRSPSADRRISAAAERVLEYMLFRNEPPLSDPVEGTSTFAQGFPAEGPRDRGGRSLRDMDLRTRLFKYPCSYLIYSPSFDALPNAIKDRIYERLWQVLTVQDTSPTFGHLGLTDRQIILEILLETKQDLPAYWVRHRSAPAP